MFNTIMEVKPRTREGDEMERTAEAEEFLLEKFKNFMNNKDVSKFIGLKLAGKIDIQC